MALIKLVSTSEIPYSVNGSPILIGEVFEMENNIASKELLGNGRARLALDEEKVNEDVKENKSDKKKR